METKIKLKNQIAHLESQLEKAEADLEEQKTKHYNSIKSKINIIGQLKREREYSKSLEDALKFNINRNNSLKDESVRG